MKDLLREVMVMLPLWSGTKTVVEARHPKYGIAADLLKYEDATIRFKMIRRGVGRHEYQATLQGGKWPSDDDLITLADGGDPDRVGHPGHFGGRVEPRNNQSTKTKRVSVNID
jgi:hypothetical protein